MCRIFVDDLIAGLTQAEISDVAKGSVITAVRVVVWAELRLTELSRVASAHSYRHSKATIKYSTVLFSKVKSVLFIEIIE